MSHRLTGPGVHRDPATTPEDDQLGRQLLPPLANGPGPAHRRTQSATGDLARAAVASMLAIQEERAQEASRGDCAERATRGSGSHSRAVRRMLVAVAASFVLLSFGALAAAVVARVLEERPAPAQNPGSAPHRPPEAPAPTPVVTTPVNMSKKAPDKVRRRHRLRTRPGAKTANLKGAAPPEVDLELNLESASLEDLFALANRLRKSRDWRAADAVYGAVTTRFPGSDAAMVAEIASASLHLEPLHDPKGALGGYLRALAARPTGALSEDARWGVAEAHRGLGEREAELSALRDFLGHHPDAGLAPAARRRIAELAPSVLHGK